MPAIRATSNTSPLAALRSRIIDSVEVESLTRPLARAVRSDSGLLPTSTMRLAPDSSKCVSFDILQLHKQVKERPMSIDGRSGDNQLPVASIDHFTSRTCADCSVDVGAHCLA